MPSVPDASPPVSPWIRIIGSVTIVVALWAARDLAFPVVLATLLTFLLSGPVGWLERRIGKVAAVLAVVGLSFAALGIGLWIVTWQLDGLVRDLPRYRKTLVGKVVELRKSGRNGAVDELQKTIQDVKEGLGAEEPQTARRRPTVVLAERIESGEGAFPWFGSVIGFLAQIGVIVTLVIFMLLERRDLRDRIIGLIGRGHVALTTRALDEAGRRVARHLLMQSIVNGIYGAVAAVALWYLGVPYALLWAILGAALRFIPYLGPIVAAGAPLVVSMAATNGWGTPLAVAGTYAVLELFTNLVLETVLYAGAAGVSQVGLLLSVTFWTWLWGPAGLLVATPLTVVLVVMGKHVRGLQAIATLMADTTVLPPAQGCYQRLLARDSAEAADLVERHVETNPPRSVYDALLLPVITYVEADRMENRITADDAGQVLAALQELVDDAADLVRREEADATDPAGADHPPVDRDRTLRALTWTANGVTDDLSLAMLTQAVDDLPVEVRSGRGLTAGELGEAARAGDVDVVCLVELPPRSPVRTRYLLRKLRTQAPGVRVIACRWAADEFADASPDALTTAGASHVSSTLLDTRAQFAGMIANGHPGATDTPVPASAPSSAAAS